MEEIKMSYFEERKKEILDKLDIDIKSKDHYIDMLMGLSNSSKKINKLEMELIRLKELFRKIGNITEDI